jgi:hypothetical protein
MGGQLRVAPSGAILGWELGAALAMATAFGLDPLLAAEILPVIEAAAVRGLNQTLMASLDKDHG